MKKVIYVKTYRMVGYNYCNYISYCSYYYIICTCNLDTVDFNLLLEYLPKLFVDFYITLGPERIKALLYNLRETVPFNPAYITGFQAECTDETEESLNDKAVR